MAERNYLRITGSSITSPADYRDFKPYVYRGGQPWKPEPIPEYTCETSGTQANQTTYRQHHRGGETPCGPCRAFNTLRSRRYEQKKRHGITCKAPAPCSSYGYTWHLEQGETPCPACTRHHQKENQK